MNEPFKGLPEKLICRRGPADGMTVPNQGQFVILFREVEPFHPLDSEKIDQLAILPDRLHKYRIHHAGYYEYQGLD